MKTRNVAVEKSRAAGGRPARRAETLKKPLLARDLMTHPVRQVQAATPVRDAAAFLVRHGISGAPVLDEHGRWVGVFTQNDLARYAQEQIVPRTPERTLETRGSVAQSFAGDLDAFGSAPVRDYMTPGMFTVFPDATLAEIVHAMVTFRVHRLFVIDPGSGTLEGALTTMDVMRALDRPGAKRPPNVRRS